jgi:hypothetical protein
MTTITIRIACDMTPEQEQAIATHLQAYAATLIAGVVLDGKGKDNG